MFDEFLTVFMDHHPPNHNLSPVEKDRKGLRRKVFEALEKATIRRAKL